MQQIKGSFCISSWWSEQKAGLWCCWCMLSHLSVFLDTIEVREYSFCPFAGFFACRLSCKTSWNKQIRHRSSVGLALVLASDTQTSSNKSANRSVLGFVGGISALADLSKNPQKWFICSVMSFSSFSMRNILFWSSPHLKAFSSFTFKVGAIVPPHSSRTLNTSCSDRMHILFFDSDV